MTNQTQLGSIGLKAWRKAFGLTQKEAAQLFDMTQGHWSNLETGRRGARKRLAKRIATHTGIPIESILY